MLTITPEAQERIAMLERLLADVDMPPAWDVRLTIWRLAQRWGAFNADAGMCVMIYTEGASDFGFIVEDTTRGTTRLVGGIILHALWLRDAVVKGATNRDILRLVNDKPTLEWGIHT